MSTHFESVPPSPEDPYEKMVVESILDKSPSVKWQDLAGLSYAKKVLYEVPAFFVFFICSPLSSPINVPISLQACEPLPRGFCFLDLQARGKR